MTKTFSVRLPDETYQQLVEDADRLGLNPAVMARAYIKMCVDRRTDMMEFVEHEAGDPPVPSQIGQNKRKNRKNKKR